MISKKNDVTDANGVVFDAGGIIGENAHNVLYSEGVTDSALLDGFIITAGKTKTASACMGHGSGFHCNGSGKGNICSPTIKNIIFSGNMACELGGAMYNDGSYGGKSSTSLTNIVFSGNRDYDGGAIFNNGYSGKSSPI